jgi:predicted dehydrogenase
MGLLADKLMSPSPYLETDSMNKFKAIQIGCGGRAQTHARAIAQVERLDFAATCDLVEERAQRTADANGVKRVHTDFRQVIETEQPDVVTFVTPPSIRSQVILPILEYRPKALVIEKPMALSLEEAETMVAAADEAGTCFVVCHQCRYSKEMIQLRDLIQSGRLGKPEKVMVNCRLDLLDQGTHILDLVEMMFPNSEPQWVLAQVDGAGQSFAQEGNLTCKHAIIQIGYSNGIVVFASIGNRSPVLPENPDNVSLQFQVSVIGSDGYGEATLAHGLDAFFAEGEAEQSRFPGFDVNANMTQSLYEEVVDVLEGKKEEHQASAHGALHVQRILNAAYGSALQNRAIAIPN